MSNPQQGAGAYGAGKAGGAFDPVLYIKKPQVILRLVSLIFSIVVFGCISSKAYNSKHQCQMNNDMNACGYGMGIGVLAFLICIAFLVIDAMFENLSSIQHRKYVVMADLGISAGWTFLWFVGFCYLTDAWRKTSTTDQFYEYGNDNIQAAIAFSFFSIFTWAASTFFAFRQYRMGAQDAFASGYDPEPNVSSPYSSFPGSDTGDPYQQPPFSQQKEVPDFQPPTY
ncbi:synaptogyrin-2 [Patella vulgata]|uniref:synaptogyrin-2 n=1 Tax=Patella vulgata TaxID=6465 RepID=UPI0021804885|nr:synaptogyrin-2 [Patella vulgata]